jgi:type II secretory pathway pseudopilin PulG
MVCGLVFFLWPFTAIAAIVLGHLALSEIKKSAGRLAGRGMATAGLIMGYIGVALVPFILIIAAIAIPNLLRAKMAANEASAVGTLRTYNTAIVTYASACPDIGYPASLENLGPGSKDCNRLNVVDASLAEQAPAKNGYHFFYRQIGISGGSPRTGYVLAASPIAPGTSGVRYFFTDESGIIRASIGGSADVNSEPLN